ncbi:MAG: YlbF family regulator [Anaeroplasmataceae bacterium]
MLSKLDVLNNKISKIDTVAQLKKLEQIVDSNSNIEVEFNKLKDIQKRLVNAKHYKNNNVNLTEKEYNAQKQYINDIPFVEEYLELLEEADNLINCIAKYIDSNINDL